GRGWYWWPSPRRPGPPENANARSDCSGRGASDDERLSGLRQTGNLEPDQRGRRGAAVEQVDPDDVNRVGRERESSFFALARSVDRTVGADDIAATCKRPARRHVVG